MDLKSLPDIDGCVEWCTSKMGGIADLDGSDGFDGGFVGFDGVDGGFDGVDGFDGGGAGLVAADDSGVQM